MSAVGHLTAADPSADADALVHDEEQRIGFVMNATRLWSHLPTAKLALFELMEVAADAAQLTYRQRGVLVTAAAAGLGDPYCALAWGTRLADHAGADVATNIVDGQLEQLATSDRVLARWARRVVSEPTTTTTADVAPLRGAGFTDRQIFAITVYVALRVSFSTVNNSLGAQPDAVLVERAPASLRSSIGMPTARQPRHR